MGQSFGFIAGAAALLTTLSPVSAHAATYPMRQTKIELNGHVLSAPSAFTWQKTTYIPLYYVQQLLNQLHIQNNWDGTTWAVTTPFPSQPTFTLHTQTGPMNIVINQKTFDPHVDKIVTLDPSSKKNTTFIPIWYIQQTLKSLGLTSHWNGTVWNVVAAYTDDSKTGQRLGSFSSLSDAEQALLDYPGGIVKDDVNGSILFTEVSFKNVDLRYPAPTNINGNSVNQYLSSHSILMAGLGQTFMDAQSRYGVNANYLVSHAIEESGSSGNFSEIALQKNNLYGYGAFDANADGNAGTFPSQAYAILFQAWEVRNNYLNPGSSHYTTPTLSGIAQNYASDPDWANKVNNLMDQFAIDEHDNVTSYMQYTSSNDPNTPANSAAIPVYYMDGAMGSVEADPYYGSNVPVYSDGGTGHKYMFVRVLQSGDVGDDVQTLQAALNNAETAGLTTDGIFGNQTQAALEEYQSNHGLPVTGACDFNVWNMLGLNHAVNTVMSGQTVQIDEIVEGMTGNHVIEWYHIPNVGWISSDDVTLNNVYRVTAPALSSAADATIVVTNTAGSSIGTLHVGDYVVSQNPTAANGKISIQSVNQSTNSTVTGYIDTAKAGLTKVSH